MPFYGAAILCLDDENVQQLLPSVNRRTITYGRSQAALHIVDCDCGAFREPFLGSRPRAGPGPVSPARPRLHNVLNATAAIAVGLELEVSLDAFAKPSPRLPASTGDFRLAAKRGVTVIDDYGHHPTEIRATLAAAQLCNFGRILAVFQPHRYTRTQHLLDEFAKSFHQADLVFVLDIYAASELPIAGITADVWPSAFATAAIARSNTREPSSRPPMQWSGQSARGPGADAGRRKCLASG